MNRIRLTVTAIVAASLLAAACGSSGADTTTAVTAADGSGAVFGRGSVPATVPESFPIPDEAVVGATLVDTNRGVTEMVLNLPATFAAAVAYYEQNLPGSGYEVTSSGGSEVEWEMVFIGGDADGTVGVKAAGNGLSSIAVQLTHP
ncbi:MAG TPA: hypothetical protein VFD97_07880 [Acidimicrobiia bacterium]|nr:hypothetical protein [Acidimicrobiia bacterium]